MINNKADITALLDISRFNHEVRKLGRVPVPLRDIFCTKNKKLNEQVLKSKK